MGPVEPVAPVGPVSPWVPVGPVGPVEPAAPFGPVEPVLPFWPDSARRVRGAIFPSVTALFLICLVPTLLAGRFAAA
ncbi:MAG: hypothetical protein QOK31_1625 [Solirubrobacteraceae bacterium]|nr:hypothetical protein [Solirubrobacteraceae bacterium]